MENVIIIVTTTSAAIIVHVERVTIFNQIRSLVMASIDPLFQIIICFGRLYIVQNVEHVKTE